MAAGPLESSLNLLRTSSGGLGLRLSDSESAAAADSESPDSKKVWFSAFLASGKTHAREKMFLASLLLACVGSALGVVEIETTLVTVPQERGHVVVHKRLTQSVLGKGVPFEVVYTVLNIGTECVLRAPTDPPISPPPPPFCA